MNEQNLDPTYPESEYNSYSALLQEMQSFLSAEAETSVISLEDASQNSLESEIRTTENIVNPAALDESEHQELQTGSPQFETESNLTSDQARPICDFTQALSSNVLPQPNQTVSDTNLLGQIELSETTPAENTLTLEPVSQIQETDFDDELKTAATKSETNYDSFNQNFIADNEKSFGQTNDDSFLGENFGLPDKTFLSLDDLAVPEPNLFQGDTSTIPEPPIADENAFSSENVIYEHSSISQDESADFSESSNSDELFLENEISMPTFVLEQTESFAPDSTLLSNGEAEETTDSANNLMSAALNVDASVAQSFSARDGRENAIDYFDAENRVQQEQDSFVVSEPTDGHAFQASSESVIYRNEQPTELAASIALSTNDVIKQSEAVSNAKTKQTAAVKAAPAASLDLNERYIVFRLDEQLYAFSAINIAEVGHPLPITPLPFVPSWFLGIANLRGDILSVIGLREFWSKKPVVQQKAKMLILRSRKNDLTVGVVVDGVREMRHIVIEEISAVDENSDEQIALYQIGRVNCDGQKLQLLDAEKLLAALKL